MDRRGQTLVEFALVLPLLLMLIFGIVEFGRIYSAKLALDHAANVAGREATFARTPAHITARAIDATAGIVLTAEDVTVTFTDDNGDPVSGTEAADNYMIFNTPGSVYARVRLQYRFEPFVPFPAVVEQGELLLLTAESFVKVQ